MNNTTQSTILTPSFINENIGNTIIWYAFGDRSNFPMKGKCKLLGTETDKRGRTIPVIHHIAGLELTYSWLDYDGTFTISDNARPVYVGEVFELYNIVYDNPKMGFTKANGNPMHVGMVHWLSNDIRDEVKRRVSGTEYELHLIV